MKKNRLGQFFTKERYWEQKQVIEFIGKYKFNTILDPFAGAGDLLNCFNNFKKLGMDIDDSLNKGWINNDSLKNIPFFEESFIITNPPYLSKTSSKRKKINHPEFKNSNHNDLYKIALDKLIESGIPGVAILPESFINSKYDKKNIFSITILIPNPFKDTDVPVCIVCYDPNKIFKDTKIFKNETFLGNMKEIENKSETLLKAKNQIQIKFNDNLGKLALIAYDSTNGKKIRFMKSENLEYNKPQKVSSRVVSKITISRNITNSFVEKLNNKLDLFRNETKDILLTPFRGNNKFQERRRRLDYKTARKIINSI
ncbi:MAG: hypothetical protein GY679_04490 [Mycoplasma sp.]|nr:hypothetical protein [Mycoplasma sp.]